MDIGEKVAFVRGLAAGLELDENSKNGKIISNILSILSDMAADIKDLQEKVKTLNEYVDEIDHDLGEVEEIMTDDAVRMPPPRPMPVHHANGHNHSHSHADNVSGECGCGCGHDTDDFIADAEEEFLDGVVEIRCPLCRDTMFLEVENLMDGDVVVCPNCKGEFQGSSGDCGQSCGCGCNCAADCDDTDTEDEDENEELHEI